MMQCNNQIDENKYKIIENYKTKREQFCFPLYLNNNNKKKTHINDLKLT